jgi:hypothetical protein
MKRKHTKVDSKFSLAAAFWKSEEPDVVLTGTLVSNDRGVAFNAAPNYARSVTAQDVSSALGLTKIKKVPVLVGFTEEGPFTLFELTETGGPGLLDLTSGQCIRASTYHSVLAVAGIHLKGYGDDEITSARFEYSGLSEWLWRPKAEIDERGNVSFRISADPKRVCDLGIQGPRIYISIQIHWESPNRDEEEGQFNRAVPSVEIRSQSPRPVHWYLDIANRLENFFSLLTGSSRSLKTLTVYRGEEKGFVIAKRLSRSTEFDLIDSVLCTSSQLGSALAVWLSEPEGFRSVENLSLVVVRKGKLFIETEFLALAQALEGFHRVAYKSIRVERATFRKVRKDVSGVFENHGVNPELAEKLCQSMGHALEPTFSARLRELCESFSANLQGHLGIDEPEFVPNVVVTRNFYTHAGSNPSPRRGRKPVTGKALVLLNQKMRAMLRGILLMHLGLLETQLSELLVREATRVQV